MWTVWSKEMHTKQAAMRDGGAGTVRKRRATFSRSWPHRDRTVICPFCAPAREILQTLNDFIFRLGNARTDTEFFAALFNAL